MFFERASEHNRWFGYGLEYLNHWSTHFYEHWLGTDEKPDTMR